MLQSNNPTIRPTRPFLVSVLLAVFLPGSAIGGDSTDLSPGLSISKRASSSIIGTTTDRKLCRYHSDDGLIHCNSENGSSGSEEFIVESTSRPRFSSFGSNTSGRVTASRDARYAFSHAETRTALSDGTAFAYCKLALQFQIANNDTLWVWHDEIQFTGSGAIAYIDSNGDQQADFAVRGSWTGRVNGVQRWEPVNPRSTVYTAAQKAYPARPFFGTTGTRNRACRASRVIVAKLVPAAPKITSTITGALRTTLGVSGN